jgi:hypothetical protein
MFTDNTTVAVRVEFSPTFEIIPANCGRRNPFWGIFKIFIKFLYNDRLNDQCHSACHYIKIVCEVLQTLQKLLDRGLVVGYNWGRRSLRTT